MSTAPTTAIISPNCGTPMSSGSVYFTARGGSIYAFWGRAGNGKGSADDGTAVGGLTKGRDSAADQWELSYSYPLSLRTLLYAGFVKLNNRANARYNFNINDYITVPGARPTGIVFGMAHFF